MDDPWWRWSKAIEDFNDRRKDLLSRSYTLILDECMSAWKPHTSATGRLRNISFVIRKLKPLGTEFKVVCCPVTGCMIAIEIQRGKKGMKISKYHTDLGATTACTIRLTEEAMRSGGHGNCTKGDAWFGSVKCCANLLNLGVKSVLQVKQNSGLYPKQYIDDALKYAPGGMHIVLEGMDPWFDLPIVAVGYRYSANKTIFCGNSQ